MKALLVLAFGGPRSLDEVEPFLIRLFRGRRPSPEQIERIRDRYRLIGGSSPLPEITRAQAKRLEENLSRKGYSFKSYVGMRYGHPLIEETLEEILRDGPEEIVAIPMAPFRSSASTGAYVEEVQRILRTAEKSPKVSFVEGWHCSPLFVEAVRERIKEGLEEFPKNVRKGIHLIFTAHSLPRTVAERDPYVKDIEESVRRVLEGLRTISWHIAFQSKGGGSEEWLGPDVESVLTDLSREKVAGVLVVPIGFVSDHIEILYDIDIVFRSKADSLGIPLKRTRSLNASDHFIDALADAVEGVLGSPNSMISLERET